MFELSSATIFLFATRTDQYVDKVENHVDLSYIDFWLHVNK